MRKSFATIISCLISALFLASCNNASEIIPDKNEDKKIEAGELISLSYYPGYADEEGGRHYESLMKNDGGEWIIECLDQETHDEPATITTYAVMDDDVERFETFIKGNNVLALTDRKDSDDFVTDYSPWSYSIIFDNSSIGGDDYETYSIDEFKEYSDADSELLKKLRKQFENLRGEVISETVEGEEDDPELSEEETEEEELTEEEPPRPARDLTPEQEMLFSSMSMWEYNYSNDFLNWKTVFNTYEDGYFKGTDNGTDFNGYFGEAEEIEPKIYKVAIEEINYKTEPKDTEDPHGFQGVDSVMVYLPGAAWSSLDPEYALLTSSECFLAEAIYNFCDHSADDDPEDMIFAGIYAEQTRAYFTSVYNGGGNCVYLKNRYVFPGIKNKDHGFFENETYDFRDANADGSVTISNICTDGKDSAGMEKYERSDWEELARKCAGRVMDGKEISDIKIWLPEDEEPDHHDEYSVKPEYEYVNAQKAFAAWWNAGSGAEKMNYAARIIPYNGFTYIYAIGINPGKVDDVTTEALDHFITSLTFTAIPEGLSNDSPDDEARYILGTVGGHFKKGRKTELSVDIKEDNGRNTRYDIADGCGIYKDQENPIEWYYDYYYGYETLKDVAEGMKIDPNTIEEGEDYPYDITDKVYYIYLNKDDQIVFMYEKPIMPEEE